MTQTLVQHLAQAIMARAHCKTRPLMGEALAKQEACIKALVQKLPSGSGIDNGTRVDLARSSGECLVLETAFHHMDEHGYYDGWTNHTIRVKPHLVFGLTLTISGSNKRDIKDHLSETYRHALGEKYQVSWETQTETYSVLWVR